MELVDDVRLGAAEAAGEGQERGRLQTLAGQHHDQMLVQRCLNGGERGVIDSARHIDIGDLATQGIGQATDRQHVGASVWRAKQTFVG
jgi:hypothetical protein